MNSADSFFPIQEHQVSQVSHRHPSVTPAPVIWHSCSSLLQDAKGRKAATETELRALSEERSACTAYEGEKKSMSSPGAKMPAKESEPEST